MSMNSRLLRPTASGFSPRSISGLALWLDAADPGVLYTTDAGPVTAVSSPLDIAGCVGWYDAADSATLFDAQSGGSVVTTNGATVARWQDKSGGGRHLTQSTANTGLPTLSTSALAGRNVVAFGGTGTGAGFTMTSPVSRATHTVIAVYYSDTGGDATASIINDGTGGFGLLIARGAVTFAEGSSGNSTVGSGRIQSQLSASVVAVGPAISSWLHAGTPSLFQNGSSIGSGTTSGSVSLSRVGYYNVANTIFRVKGYIAELVIFDNALSTSQRARVESYLAAKWGIAGVHAPATASSDPVGYWGDKSGNGRHAVQATAGSRPVVGSVNSRRALTFDGSNDFLSADVATSSLCSTDGGVAFYIAVPNNVSTWSAFSNAGSSAPGHIDRFGDGASYHGNFRGSRFSGITPGAYSTTGAQLIVSRTNAATGLQTIRKDGATIHSAAENIAGYRAQSSTATVNVAATVTSVGPPAVRGQFLNGSIPEIICYSSPLTDVQVRRIETYLAARWGITLAPQVANADAQDWVNRVYANGGSVSTATAQAVNTFCSALENAPGGSIRDRFFRLNLFAGNSDAALNAVRTPLFRGPSLGGTQYGNTTDTNNNFLAGDYAETAGLKGNGSTQYLNTGYPANTLAALNTHLAIGLLATETRANADRTAIGAVNTGNTVVFAIDLRRPNAATGVSQRLCSLGVYDPNPAFFGDNGHAASMAIGNLVATDGKQYRNGSETGTANSPLTDYGAAHSIYLFANNNGAAAGEAINFTDARIGSYSVGAVMTAGQVASYNSALAAFNSTLART